MTKIKIARLAIGLHQGDLAKAMGTTQGAVSQWEKGLTKPTAGKLKRLAEILGVTVDELLDEGGQTWNGC